MNERRGVVTFQGKPLTLLGIVPEVGNPAPEFVAVNNDLEPVNLSRYRGRPVVLVSVPSLDTPVCSTEVRRFNQEAAGLSDRVRVVTVSMDLPFAQSRWCGAHGIERVETLSDHRDGAFGRAYGVSIKELRLLARAVFVLDPDHHVRYVQVVPELTNEPDYPAALEAAGEVA